MTEYRRYPNKEEVEVMVKEYLDDSLDANLLPPIDLHFLLVALLKKNKHKHVKNLRTILAQRKIYKKWPAMRPFLA